MGFTEETFLSGIHVCYTYILLRKRIGIVSKRLVNYHNGFHPIKFWGMRCILESGPDGDGSMDTNDSYYVRRHAGVQRGYLSGHPFIAKPFRTKSLTKRIEDVLSAKQHRIFKSQVTSLRLQVTSLRPNLLCAL
jgi:hypothetical protein